jgi:hypothetical protein
MCLSLLASPKSQTICMLSFILQIYAKQSETCAAKAHDIVALKCGRSVLNFDNGLYTELMPFLEQCTLVRH